MVAGGIRHQRLRHVPGEPREDRPPSRIDPGAGAGGRADRRRGPCGGGDPGWRGGLPAAGLERDFVVQVAALRRVPAPTPATATAAGVAAAGAARRGAAGTAAAAIAAALARAAFLASVAVEQGQLTAEAVDDDLGGVFLLAGLV